MLKLDTVKKCTTINKLTKQGHARAHNTQQIPILCYVLLYNTPQNASYFINDLWVALSLNLGQQ